METIELPQLQNFGKGRGWTMTVYLFLFKFQLSSLPSFLTLLLISLWFKTKQNKKVFALITIELFFFCYCLEGFLGVVTGWGFLLIDSLYTWPYSIFGYSVIFTLFCKLISFQGTYGFFPGMHLIPTQRGCL